MRKTSKAKPTFVQNLIEMRLKKGLTSMALAEKAEIPYPTLRDIEAGVSGGRLSTKEKLAVALGTTIDVLNTPKPHESQDSVIVEIKKLQGMLASNPIIAEINGLLGAFNDDELRGMRRLIQSMIRGKESALLKKYKAAK